MELLILRSRKKALEPFKAWEKGRISDEHLIRYAYEPAGSTNPEKALNFIASKMEPRAKGLIICASNDALWTKHDGRTVLLTLIHILEALVFTYGSLNVLIIHNRPAMEKVEKLLWELGYVPPSVIVRYADHVEMVVMEKEIAPSRYLRIFLGHLSSKGLGKLLKKQFTGTSIDIQKQLSIDVGVNLFLRSLNLKEGKILAIIWSRGATGDTLLVELLRLKGDPRNPIPVPLAHVHGLIAIDWPAMSGLDPKRRDGRIEGAVRLMHKVFARLGPATRENSLSLVATISNDRAASHKLALMLSALIELNSRRFRASNDIDPSDLISWLEEKFNALIRTHAYLCLNNRELMPYRPLVGVGHYWIPEKTVRAIFERSDVGAEREEFTGAVVLAMLNSITFFYEPETLSSLLGREIHELIDAASDVVFGMVIFVFYPSHMGLDIPTNERLHTCISEAAESLGINDWRLVWIPLEESGGMVHILAVSLLSPLQALDAEFELGFYDEWERHAEGKPVYKWPRRFKELIRISRRYDTGARASDNAGAMPWYHRVLVAIYKRFFGTIWQRPRRRAEFGRPMNCGQEEPLEEEAESGEGGENEGL